MRQKGKRGAVKKKKRWWTAGFIRCGVEGWVFPLKGPSSTRKKNAPMNVCDLRIRFDRCVRVAGHPPPRQDRLSALQNGHGDTTHGRPEFTQ